MTFFSCKFGFGKCFGTSSQFSHSAGHRQLSSCCIKSTFHHVTVWLENGLSLLHTIRRRHYKTMIFFFFFGQLTRHLLSSFFTFPICFKCQMIVEWPTLGSSATFCVVVRGSALMMLSIGGFQLLMAGHCVLIFKALVSFAKLLEPSPYCRFITSSWAKCVDVASCLCYFATHFELK